MRELAAQVGNEDSRQHGVSGRSGISTRVQVTPLYVPRRQRSRASAEGVAEPSTSGQR